MRRTRGKLESQGDHDPVCDSARSGSLTSGARAWRCHLIPAGTAPHYHGIGIADSGLAECAQRGTSPDPLRNRLPGENVEISFSRNEWRLAFPAACGGCPFPFFASVGLGHTAEAGETNNAEFPSPQTTSLGRLREASFSTFQAIKLPLPGSCRSWPSIRQAP